MSLRVLLYHPVVVVVVLVLVLVFWLTVSHRLVLLTTANQFHTICNYHGSFFPKRGCSPRALAERS